MIFSPIPRRPHLGRKGQPEVTPSPIPKTSLLNLSSQATCRKSGTASSFSRYSHSPGARHTLAGADGSQ
jgi:hypothetical protein